MSSDYTYDEQVRNENWNGSVDGFADFACLARLGTILPLLHPDYERLGHPPSHL